MARVYNFSAGPAVLPEEVLKEAAEEMMDYRGCGMSVMEMSHRSKTYQTIIDEAEADLRELIGIPDNYKVLFLQGGASQQFAMITMNLMKNKVAGRKRPNTEKRTKSPLLKIQPSHTYRPVPISLFLKMRIMSIFVKIILFTERNSKHYPTPRAKRW